MSFHPTTVADQVGLPATQQGRRCQERDTDSRPITQAEGRAIVERRFKTGLPE
jgi:hypothetical protein